MTRDAVPWPGGMFVILHCETGRALALVQGELRLIGASDSLAERTGCWHWECTEERNFLGLRNRASGAFIGRINDKQVKAVMSYHREWEFLCARRHPAGGYLLLNSRRGWMGSSLECIGLAEDGCSLVLTEGEGALWEFVKI